MKNLSDIMNNQDLLSIILTYIDIKNIKDIRIISKLFLDTCKKIDWKDFKIILSDDIKKTWCSSFPNTKSIDVYCKNHSDSYKGLKYLLQEHLIQELKIKIHPINYIDCVFQSFQINKLKILVIDGCSGMTNEFLGYFEQIEELDINLCIGIDNLNSLKGDNLKKLCISNCYYISEIPYYPKLTNLNIYYTDIIKLPCEYTHFIILNVDYTLINYNFFEHIIHIDNLSIRNCENITWEYIIKLFERKIITLDTLNKIL
jgi:hypothetical protein